PRRPGDRCRDSDSDGARERATGESPEHAVRNPRAERPVVKLVERVRADPETEKERDEAGTEPQRAPVGGERGADHDIAEVPERVRGVQERDVVAPAARPECVI